jgi:hypothetical protein
MILNIPDFFVGLGIGFILGMVFVLAMGTYASKKTKKTV